jgi:sulfur-carrier protein adenylyltransferase/sulfurtransferase
VAAQFLAGQGFKEVYNLKGGMMAWQGLTAIGPVELNLDLIRGDESAAEMLEVAFGLEGALQKFYLIAGENVKDREVAALIKELAAVEEKHQQMLLTDYAELTNQEVAGPQSLVKRLPQILEGGFEFSEFLNQNQATMQTLFGVLDLAMMLETQALDLYLRFAAKTTEESTQKVLFKIADQEKAHLTSLGKLVEKKTSKGLTGER